MWNDKYACENANANASVRAVAFIVTKPQELLAATAIVAQFGSATKCSLLFVGIFHGAQPIFERLPACEIGWAEKIWFDNYKACLQHCRNEQYDEIVFDGDVGFKRGVDLLRLTLVNKMSTISVYEEGLGAYRNDLYSGIKKSIFSFCGIGVNFGANRLTRKMYVYDPVEYLQMVDVPAKEVVGIILPFYQLFVTYRNAWMKTFDLDALSSDLGRNVNRECKIYLSSWTIDNKILKRLSEDGKSTTILKVHPRIKNSQDELKEHVHLVCPQHVPAEILIFLASEAFETVEVFHHGSSTERYVICENVRFQRLQ